MSGPKDCCDACSRGEECEGTARCNLVSVGGVLGVVWGPVEDQPAGTVFQNLYKPTNRDPTGAKLRGVEAFLHSFGFVHSDSLGRLVRVFLEVSLVPYATELDDAPFIRRKVILVRGVVPGSFNIELEREGLGIPLPRNEGANPWWVYVQVGTTAAPPTEPHNHVGEWAWGCAWERLQI